MIQNDSDSGSTDLSKALHKIVGDFDSKTSQMKGMLRKFVLAVEHEVTRQLHEKEKINQEKKEEMERLRETRESITKNLQQNRASLELIKDVTNPGEEDE